MIERVAVTILDNAFNKKAKAEAAVKKAEVGFGDAVLKISGAAKALRDRAKTLDELVDSFQS